MRNYIQKGNVITIAAPTGGVLSGQGIFVGNLFGVAATDAAEGENVEIVTHGVFTLPKAANATFVPCARVSWDATNGQLVAPATGMIPLGVAILAAANGTTSARIRLDGVSTVAA